MTTALVVIAVAAFLLLAIGPRLMGYQTTTMLTGSMSPGINPGDVVVAGQVPVADIKVGDVITYHIPIEDHRVETHRVVEIKTGDDGLTAVRTKGDANQGIDPWTATLQGQTIYRHVGTIPYLGAAIRALRAPVVSTILMYGVPAILVIGVLLTIWRKEPDKADPTTVTTTTRPA
ncbi:signal peptidase I [Paeniglutamicibacter antarcticus]|uniref:Signal peptidase I n=1 Tax=Arthrobacter terrae TaxID=2935737 RepID=A0A931CPY6_9MICC|nr:signal peptidase I [Arthrobacter terrae]